MVLKRILLTAILGLNILFNPASVPLTNTVEDDFVVAGSLCVGVDCIANESFDYDTLRLKENNLRLEFQDTSDTGLFPTTDWLITINDTNYGGDDYFAIDSVDNGQRPFRIDYGAPNDALHIDDNGWLGVGTSMPAAKLAVENTAGDDIDDFVVTSDGEVGIGTTDIPHSVGVGKLAVVGTNGSTDGPHAQFTTTQDGYPVLQLLNWTHDNVSISFDSYFQGGWKSSDSGSNFQIRKLSDNLYTRFATGYSQGATVTWKEGTILTSDGKFGIGGTVPDLLFEVRKNDVPKLLLDDTGNMTITGVLAELSDVTAKENIKPVDGADILQRLEELPISTWTLKADVPTVRHMGPMAQDFYATFGLGHDNRHIASLDTAGVALAAIQELSRQNQELEARIAALEARIEALEACAP